MLPIGWSPIGTAKLAGIEDGLHKLAEWTDEEILCELNALVTVTWEPLSALLEIEAAGEERDIDWQLHGGGFLTTAESI